ncbi:regulatory protein, arsR family [Paenibacillus sp. UNCCL117]|uniref:ArsR family transcriptional regulator n=1 Tax=unclassified Paenibacillus TaxID=185978 RepID=UPI00087E290F|nr:MULTISPECIES: ArsR family transcriptional regulator [unclassified Paenibacillus]SDD27844.1 regulatory protein, arsR family [Paenibacillus sp. cl123]SFW41015.1 regulatory protein, arsR family [Paenibacillus sp. UNCCL117]
MLYVHRRMTIRQIAEELDTNKGAVQRHLKQLLQLSPRIRFMVRRQAEIQRHNGNASRLDVQPMIRVFNV